MNEKMHLHTHSNFKIKVFILKLDVFSPWSSYTEKGESKMEQATGWGLGHSEVGQNRMPLQKKQLVLLRAV